MNNPVTGFSKLSKKKNKLDYQEYFSTPSELSFYYKTIGTQMKKYKATRWVH
jgi:hypothetical protein